MIVLDTHAWIWWVADPARLSRAAKKAIEKERVRGVCAISVWELARLIERRRLALDREVTDWVRDALALPGVELLPLTPEIALVAGGAGREARLVTKDERLRAFQTLDTVW